MQDWVLVLAVLGLEVRDFINFSSGKALGKPVVGFVCD
jgi:hypothetical protein